MPSARNLEGAVGFCSLQILHYLIKYIYTQIAKHQPMQHDDHEIKLQKRDCDIRVVMPHGETITFQFRLVSNDEPTLDILFDQRLNVACWHNNDMEPADKAMFQDEHVRDSAQLCVMLPLKYIGESAPGIDL